MTHTAISHVDDKYFLQTKPPSSTYRALRLVSRSVAEECRVALLRTSPVLVEKQKDLTSLIELLPSTEIAAVRAILVKVTHTYYDDGIAPDDREYDCLDISYAELRNTFPKLKFLRVDQDPGSVILHSQLPFETIAEDVTLHDQKRHFMNGWGYLSTDSVLVGSAYGAMGPRLLRWFQGLIDKAYKDHIQVDVTIRFHCAAHPRLRREDIVGSMSMNDKILVIEHAGQEWHLPQLFDTVPVDLDLPHQGS